MSAKLRIEEVALLVGTSTQTINNWYRFKALHPENDLAQKLPDYEQSGPVKHVFGISLTSGPLLNLKTLCPTAEVVFWVMSPKRN